MKIRLSSVLILLFAALPFLLPAQCSPVPTTGGTTFSFGVTDSVTPSLFVPSPFIVCDNATLYYYGNNPDTVYLEGSARLKVGYCYNLVVYMKNNATLDIEPGMLPVQYQIAHLYYDPTFTQFIDTVHVDILGMTSCTGMAYDYSLFPNGNTPCTQATGISAQATVAPFMVYPNPAIDEFNVELLEPGAGKGCTVELFNLQGVSLGKKAMQSGAVRWETGDLARGMYFVRVNTETGHYQQVLNLR